MVTPWVTKTAGPDRPASKSAARRTTPRMALPQRGVVHPPKAVIGVKGHALGDLGAGQTFSMPDQKLP